MRLLKWRCESFFCFSPIFCFLFPFGSRAIRYYSSTRTTVAVQTSNSLENEEYSLFAVRSIHTSCRLHGPFSADVYMYPTRKNLHIKPFLLFVFFSLMRSPLMVFVSYIELFFTTDFAVEYAVPYIGTTFSLLVRKYVTPHMYYS